MNSGAGPFLTPGAFLNKLGRGPLGDAKYHSHFPYIRLYKTDAPLGGAISSPRAIIGDVAHNINSVICFLTKAK